jgi:hypothetical protein
MTENTWRQTFRRLDLFLIANGGICKTEKERRAVMYKLANTTAKGAPVAVLCICNHILSPN